MQAPNSDHADNQDLHKAIDTLKKWTDVLTVLVFVLVVCAFIIFFLQLLKFIATSISFMVPEKKKKRGKVSKKKSKHDAKETKSNKNSKSDSSSVKDTSSKKKDGMNAFKAAGPPIQATTFLPDKTAILPIAQPPANAQASADLITPPAIVSNIGVVDPSKSEKAAKSNVSTSSKSAANSAIKTAKLRALDDKKLINPVEGTSV